MSWLKELSLVVILGCCAVLAEADKSSENTPPVINDEDVKLLINPSSFFQIKPDTPKPPLRPQIIFVKPGFPHYPYYNKYPSYRNYPYDDLHKPHLPYPSQPTDPIKQPTMYQYVQFAKKTNDLLPLKLVTDEGREQNVNESKNTPRVINDEDVKLLINPFSFFQIKPDTSKPPLRPPTIIVKPGFPHYPYYPNYPFYPNYPYDDLHKPHLPYPSQPTYPIEQPTKPTPVQPPHLPINPSYPPLYPFYSPTSSQTPYGYYPWFFPQQPGQPLYFVVIRPPTDPTSSVPAVPEKPDLPSVPILRNVPDLPKVLDVASKGKTNDRNFVTENNGDDKSLKYFLRNPMYQYVQFAKEPKDLLPLKLVTDEGQEQNVYENESIAHNIKLNGVSITADSEEDDDTLTVDTKDIKLPFGLHLASYPSSNKKVKNQEALIYLKNFKKGRNLETETDTGTA